MITHPIAEIQRASRRTEVCGDKYASNWLQALKFIGLDGKVMSDSEVRSSKALDLFFRAAKEEARVLGASVQRKFDSANSRNTFGLTKSDVKAIERWTQNPPSENLGRYHGLTKRAVRLYRWIDGVISDEVIPKLNLYKLISPHTFCFVPESALKPEDLAKKLGERFFNIDNYIKTDTWARSGNVEVFRDSRHVVKVGAYLFGKRPRMKLKLYATNEGDGGAPDVLDVETEFEEREFKGVAHYHVVKPFTRKRLIEAQGLKGDVEIPYYFELSRNHSSGNVVMKFSATNEGEGREYTDANALERSVKASKLWNSHPVVAGGSLLVSLINIVTGDPKYQALQHDAVRKYRTR